MAAPLCGCGRRRLMYPWSSSFRRTLAPRFTIALLSFVRSTSTCSPAAFKESGNGPPSAWKSRRRAEASRRLALARQQLNEQQQQVVDAVSRGESVFITGAAGCGKTFLLRHIISLLRVTLSPRTVFVTASTGVAACAIDGQTLHSFAGVGVGLGPVPDNAEDLFRKTSNNTDAVKRWSSCHALVIDEISMIDGQLFDNLDYVARSMRPQSANLPWGGIQLIVSGDFFQLPPVNPSNPEKEFAFQAECWNRCFDRQVELLQVFRQCDTKLISVLQNIRLGNTENLNLLDQCRTREIMNQGEDEKATILFPRNSDVQMINSKRLQSLGEGVITYLAADRGEHPWRGQLGQGMAPEVLQLCVGARVMLIKNADVSAGLVNGATGIVVEFVQQEKKRGSFCVLPMVRFDVGVDLVIGPERWKVIEGQTTRASRRQIPLILAWALSVHKCQGMTLQRLHTDLSRAFCCGMVYVALSRVRSLDGLHLSGFNPKKIKAHPKVIQFYHQMLAQNINA